MKITETKPKYNDSDDDGTTTNTPAIFTSFQWHRQKKTPMDGILMKQNRRMTLITLAWQIEPARTDE